MTIDAKDYRASMEANRRMMDTTIWQACRILELDADSVRPSEAFHALYEKYYAEELEKQGA